MKSSPLRLSVGAVLATLGLGACSDGSVGSTPGTASGVVTGFGSVFVNGVEYDTTGAVVNIEGTPASEDQLAVGMVVTVEGSSDADGGTGVARSVSFRDEVEGVVLANDLSSGGTLDVMGQSVVVDGMTQFESAIATQSSPADVVQGNVVEVSGYSSGTGTIYATRIEVKSAVYSGGEMEVKGVVQALNAAAQTFMLGALTVDYSAAQLVDGAPVDGWYVEVKSTAAPVGGTLAASQIEKESDQIGLSADEGEEMEIQGVITSTAELASGTFELNGQPVRITDETEYPGAGVLSEGLRIQVEGSFAADGVLVAEEIELQEEGNIELLAPVDFADPAIGAVDVLGQTFHVDNRTILEDERGDAPVRYFGLDDLYAADTVSIHAYRDSSGTLHATSLEREDTDPSGLVQLHGPVESVVDASRIVIAGVTVDVSLTGGSSGYTVGGEAEVIGSYGLGVLTAAP